MAQDEKTSRREAADEEAPLSPRSVQPEDLPQAAAEVGWESQVRDEATTPHTKCVNTILLPSCLKTHDLQGFL